MPYTPARDPFRCDCALCSDVDGVIDFDRAVQDPANPLAMTPAYNSGDFLHPSDAGYQVMANSIDLTAFR